MSSRIKAGGVLALLTAATVAGAFATAEATPITLNVATAEIYGVANTFPVNGDDKVGDITFNDARFTGGVPDMLAALRAGQIDVAEVAVSRPWPKGEAIIVADRSPIRSIEDLRGKKVAYPRATNGQWLVVHALQSKGMTLDDIQSVFLPAGTNLLNALKAGVIDATAYVDAPLASYEAQGARRIADHGDLGFPIPLEFLASDRAIATKKEAVAAYVHQLQKHLAWAHDNPEVRADALAAVLHLDPNVVLTAEKRRPAGLQPIGPEVMKLNQEIADSFHAQKIIPKPLKADAVFTTEFNEDIGR